MPQDVNTMLAAAKGTLAGANKTFPSPKAAAPAKPVVPAAPTTKSAPTLGEELSAKKTMVDKAQKALPSMHNGGPVAADGAYQLRAGEHVLTASEAVKARKHALMAVGMKSLAKPGKTNLKKG